MNSLLFKIFANVEGLTVEEIKSLEKNTELIIFTKLGEFKSILRVVEAEKVRVIFIEDLKSGVVKNGLTGSLEQILEDLSINDYGTTWYAKHKE